MVTPQIKEIVQDIFAEIARHPDIMCFFKRF